MLQYIADPPPLPVTRFTRGFVAFITAHNRDIGMWSAYPGTSVIDIQQALGDDMTIDLSDVQGNVVRGYGLSFDCARHFALAIGDPGRTGLPGRAGRRRHLRRRQRHLGRRVADVTGRRAA